MNEMGAIEKTQADPAGTYKTFARQMIKWYNGGALPAHASQDLRFVLELQKQKLQALGLAMKCERKKGGTGKRDVGSLSFSDRIFTNTILSGDGYLTRSIGSMQEQRELYTADISLTAIIQDLKKDTQPSESMALSCPNCGVPSTLGELQTGCRHCGTHFLMNDLYPKVMNYFVNEHVDREKENSKYKRDLIKLIAVCIPPMIIVGIILRLLLGQDSSTPENIFYGIVGGIFGAAYIGVILFVFKWLFEVFGLMGKNLRGGGNTISTLFNAGKIREHDPEFSSEYFRDKIISLFRMAVYSKDAAELACCQCPCPERASEIIEAQLYNFNINSCKINDGVCDADVTLFLDCLHYKNGKIISKSDKFRMHMRKNIKAPTELGFSFAAVNCPSCGASFDARHVKACPYCGSAYLHEEHDWIVTDIR